MTEAEKRGLVNRQALLAIEGRSRKKQIGLAEEMKVTGYSCPGGGCLLTYKEFASKLKDLFEHKKKVSLKDVQMLRVGRHFRFGKNKIIVGRNEAENKLLMRMKMPNDYFFEAQDCGSPITLLQGPKTRTAVKTAAELTAYHSDRKQGAASIRFGKKEFDRSIRTQIPSQKEIEQLRITPTKKQVSK